MGRESFLPHFSFSPVLSRILLDTPIPYSIAATRLHPPPHSGVYGTSDLGASGLVTDRTSGGSFPNPPRPVRCQWSPS